MTRLAGIVFASLAAASALPATAAPIDGLRSLVGTWNCTYRDATTSFAYRNTYAYDRGTRTSRQIAVWQGGGDEELLAYDQKRGGWTGVVLDDRGNATVIRGAGSDASHIPYRSVYPDTSIADTFDRVSANEYTLHATYRMGSKTIHSVDTCVRSTR